jgi:hypothetical protein
MAVERYIKKTIPVDRDQPYHSPETDRRAGKEKEGLPQAEWVHPANHKRKRRRISFQGRRQKDFGGGKHK